jgi:hypothetical protein
VTTVAALSLPWVLEDLPKLTWPLSLVCQDPTTAPTVSPTARHTDQPTLLPTADPTALPTTSPTGTLVGKYGCRTPSFMHADWGDLLHRAANRFADGPTHWSAQRLPHHRSDGFSVRCRWHSSVARRLVLSVSLFTRMGGRGKLFRRAFNRSRPGDWVVSEGILSCGSPGTNHDAELAAYGATNASPEQSAHNSANQNAVPGSLAAPFRGKGRVRASVLPIAYGTGGFATLIVSVVYPASREQWWLFKNLVP